VAFPNPGDHEFYKIVSTNIMSGSFHVNLSFSGPMVLEKKIFK
jgi:hypothetical protein